jgi:putative spermidine/putrescine transport system ATP-binding protein
MRGELQRLHRRLGLTTVYVTHDQEEALSLADRLVVLKSGVTQQIGSPDELYNSPANVFVADFMGFRNLLPMICAQVADGAARLEAGGLALEVPTPADLRGGQSATVAIRPGDLSLAGSGPDAIAATVTAVAYLGNEFDIELEVAGGTRLYLRGTNRVSVGERVTVAVDRSRVMVYPDEVAAGPGATAESANRP